MKKIKTNEVISSGQRRKILVLAARPLEHSGITKIIMDVINRARDITDVDVASSFSFKNEYGKQLKEWGIQCINLPSKKSTISYIKAIKNLVVEIGYDTVYINGNSAMMIFEALPSKIAQARVVTHCHNTKTDYPLIHYLAKPIFNKNVDCKIAVSEMAAKWAYCGKNIKIIKNGVDLNKFYYNEEDRNKIRRELNCEEKHVIGHIGNYNKQKNHTRLIDIFRKIANVDENAVLLLLGDGELMEETKKKAERLGLGGKVLYKEFVNTPESYMRAMDVVVMPSLHEGLCLAALEVQACGIPVLVSDVFAKETFVTGNCHKLSLAETDEVWARSCISLYGSGEKQTKSRFIKEGMDYESMLQEIINSLI